MISTVISSALPFHNVAGERIGADELLERCAVGVEYGVPVPLPGYGAGIYEADIVTYLEHRVHIVGVYHGGDVELLGQIAYEFINKYGRIWVQAGIGLVTKKIFRAEGQCAGYADTLLHTSGKFGRIFVVAADDVHLFQTKLRPFPFLRNRPVGEKVHRKHHVLDYRCEIEERTALEQDSDILMEQFAAVFIHSHKAVTVVEDIPFVRLEKADEILQEHGLAAAALAYYHIALPGAENGIDIVQDDLVSETFEKSFNLYHNSAPPSIKHNLGDDKVEHKDKYAGRHYGPRTALSHSQRPPAGKIALEGGYAADQEAEKRRLETAVNDIESVETVFDALDIGGRTDYSREIHHYISADEPENETEHHKQRAEESGSDDFGLNKESRGIYTHHIHCIYLLRNSHTSNLGCYVGAHLAGKDKGHHRGAEFKNEALADHIADIHLVDEGIFQIGSRLNGKDATYENGDYGHYEYGRNYQFVRFEDKLLPIQSGVFRAGKHFPEKEEILADFFYGRFNHTITKILIKNEIIC